MFSMLLDPSDLAVDSLVIKPGVPSRGGVRKAWIVDGPSDASLSTSGMGVVYNTQPRIVFWNLGASTFGGTIVGYYGADAFTASQIFNWGTGDGGWRWRLGFRAGYGLRSRFSSTIPCRCTSGTTDGELFKWIDARTEFLVEGSRGQTSRKRTAAGERKDHSMKKFEGRLLRNSLDVTRRTWWQQSFEFEYLEEPLESFSTVQVLWNFIFMVCNYGVASKKPQKPLQA
jgi:hypothetical protein